MCVFHATFVVKMTYPQFFGVISKAIDSRALGMVPINTKFNFTSEYMFFHSFSHMSYAKVKNVCFSCNIWVYLKKTVDSSVLGMVTINLKLNFTSECMFFWLEEEEEEEEKEDEEEEEKEEEE